MKILARYCISNSTDIEKTFSLGLPSYITITNLKKFGNQLPVFGSCLVNCAKKCSFL